MVCTDVRMYVCMYITLYIHMVICKPDDKWVQLVLLSLSIYICVQYIVHVFKNK